MYNRKVVDEILNRQINNINIITFTITTCKRYDLFERTMNSFLENCTDIHLIDRWFCVDDNSSIEDREKMKHNYPFFDFYFKDISEKGHVKSMNIIREYITTPFIFHMEDDWEFFSKQNYISMCLDVLMQSHNIGQCLINKNYSELQTDKIIGGLKHTTQKGLTYFIHEHCCSDYDYKLFYTKHGSGSNCAYWKHFSFRPSLLKRVVYDNIGEFNSQAPHFEKEYSERYFKHGYVSCFLEDIYCNHIGKLTSETNNDKPNAYALNNEIQFSSNPTLESKQCNKPNFDTFVVNLDRRPDRYNTFKKNTQSVFLNYKRFSAVDGKTLQSTPDLQYLFRGNDYNMRRGIVGCALSHLQLFHNLANSTKDAYCVFEDDAVFTQNFQQKFDCLYNSLPENWDIVFLGHTERYTQQNNGLVKRNAYQALYFSYGGTFGYLISRKGAMKMIEFINRTGMTNAIDTMMQKSADILDVYYTEPRLVFSSCDNRDTDIQRDMTGIISSLPINPTLNYSFDRVIQTIPKKTNISIGEVYFISEALNDYRNPFDVVEGLTISTVLETVKRVFTTDMITTVYDFCIKPYNNLSFPYEKCSNVELFILYLKKFQNFKNLICSNSQITLIYVSKYKQYNPDLFTQLETFLQNYNKSLKIQVITDIKYPIEFQNETILQEKQVYDHCVYRFELINKIRSLI
jgi:GR25 family glycosyltransferase involved in LPS biosynthesis